MFGVNDNNGHFAVGRKADLTTANRSMASGTKTALGMANPQFLVYSADGTDANDYVRIEHDQTNANIFAGNGDINLCPITGGAVGLSGHLRFSDGTTQDTAHRGEDTATFSIRASSAISTGSKTDTLFRVPYNATFKQLQIRSGATGGFTGSFTIAGSDFGAVTTNSIHGATLGTLGFTASSTSFDFASATAGDFLFFNVGSNGAGATTVQAFVTFERR